MGPLLLSRLMDLNDMQEGVLNIAFRVADEQGLLLLDLKDLRAILGYHRRARRRAHDANTATSPRRPSARSSASCWCWRTRAAPNFFGEPALDLKDFMRTDRDGRGYINILAADKLMDQSAALRHLPAVAAVGIVRGTAGGRRSGQAEARASSSTRRICCSTTRRKRCWRRSSRWCG